jgi:uncharacterized protein
VKPFKLAFITGATSGLGRALARSLAEKNIPLFLTGRDAKSLETLKLELEKKVPTTILAVDLAKDLAPLMEALNQNPPDLVINNAGFGLYGDILSYPIDEQIDLLRVNGEIPIYLSIECARLLKQASRSGTIMNVSSAASGFIYPGFALYAASKTLLKEFSLSFDAEMKEHDIRVLTCLPGRFHSAFLDRAAGGKASPSSLTTISLEKMTRLVLKQIEKEKGCEIIDFRYKILKGFFSLVPKSLLACSLRKKR